MPQFGKSRRKFMKTGMLAGAGLWGLLGGTIYNGEVLGKEKPRFKINPDPEILFERVENVISDGRWNGRPAIVFWKGRYRLTFSSAADHTGPDSEIVMMTSEGAEPRKWSNRTTILKTDLSDLECHLLATSERLFAYIVQERPVPGGGFHEFVPEGTLVIHTDDGEHWSQPRRIYKPGWSLWKPKTHKGVHYVAADIMMGAPQLELLQSTDGLSWEKVSTILEGKYTETALLFLPDDSLLTFTRQKGPSISHSHPPYTEWKVYDGPKIGGPAAALVGNTILVSGRSYNYVYPDDQLIGTDPSKSIQRTALWNFDMDQMRLKWKMNLLTQFGADVSYPHFLVLDEHRVLLAWYDAEAYITEDDVRKVQKSDIFLAVLRIQ